MRSPSHTPTDDECPEWCASRLGRPHDIDDLYGVHGTHHDSEIVTVDLLGEDGSRLHVKVSQLVPSDGEPWPTLVEVDADLSEDRLRNGPQSVWLYGCEADQLAAALTGAARLAD